MIMMEVNSLMLNWKWNSRANGSELHRHAYVTFDEIARHSSTSFVVKPPIAEISQSENEILFIDGRRSECRWIDCYCSLIDYSWVAHTHALMIKREKFIVCYKSLFHIKRRLFVLSNSCYSSFHSWLWHSKLCDNINVIVTFRVVAMIQCFKWCLECCLIRASYVS